MSAAAPEEPVWRRLAELPRVEVPRRAPRCTTGSARVRAIVDDVPGAARLWAWSYRVARRSGLQPAKAALVADQAVIQTA